MTNQHVLIIDDEPDIRELLEITLIRMGINTSSAESVSVAKEKLGDQHFDLCLTDMNLPDGNGIDLVMYIQQSYPDIPVAMITAYGNVETAISALKAGAFDFISKPVDLNQLRGLVTSALKLSSLDTTNKVSKSQSSIKKPDQVSSPELIKGKTPAIQKLNQQIIKLARSQAPIYISGESGSGKELVARMIHEKSPRAHNGPFIPVNCGAIPSELVESEFFGHKKGSFSGAIEDKPGLFRAAQGGTLFLDEVADLPLGMQVKLLRAIQEKSIRPVGEQIEISVDVRILSATHKDLATLVDEGLFRQDLFYRINVIKLEVPSLRERKDDVPLLAQHFLSTISKECDVDHAEFHSQALSTLEQYDFPGNVRELENIIERAFTLCEDNIIQAQDLSLGDYSHEKNKPIQTQHVSRLVSELIPQDTSAQLKADTLMSRAPDQALEEYLESIERVEIEKALQATKWNRTAAAKMLGMSFRALRYRLKKLELD